MNDWRYPAGRPVPDTEPWEHLDNWVARRRQGIGASDLPILLDLSPYSTPLDLYVSKVSGDSGESSEAARWGHILETPIAEAWARDHDRTIERCPIVQSLHHPWAFASPDGLVLDCPDHETCGLEVKNRSAFKATEWRHAPPDDVTAQVQWQLLCTGWNAVHVAALIGGNTPEFRYVIEPDQALIDDLVVVAHRFWEDVEARRPPDFDYDRRLLQTLQRMYPDRGGEQIVDRRMTVKVMRRRSRLRAIRDRAQAELDACEARLARQLGDAVMAIDDDGAVLYTYKPSTQTRVDLGELRKHYPAIVSECQTTIKTKPVLRPGREFR